jgi:hypothetical protein
MPIRALTNDATESRTVFVTNAHCDHGKRFVVRADEKLAAFLELEWGDSVFAAGPKNRSRLALM